MGSNGDERNLRSELSSKMLDVESAARPVTMEKEQRRGALGRRADPDRDLRPRGLLLVEPLSKCSDRRALEQQAIGYRLSRQLPQFEHELRGQQRIAPLVKEIIIDGEV